MTDLTMPPITPVPFTGIMAFVWIGIFLVIGMFLRSTFPVFRRYLIPACIIGGTVGFFFQSFGVMNATGFGTDNKAFQVIVYHLFNLTWVYLGLRIPPPKTEKSAGILKFGLWYAVMLPLLLAVGVIASAGSSTISNMLGLSAGPDSLGALTSFGFGQGPGQALTIAKIWETASNFTGMSDFAMAGASMGFAVAILVGVPAMNIIARKKKINILTDPSPEEACGYYNECTEQSEAGKVTTAPSNIDTFAWHIALGLIIYFITFFFAVILIIYLPNALKPFVWSTFFIMCNIVGMLARICMEKINKQQLLCNGVNARISNTLVDFLVCGTFISIQVGNVAQYVWPYALSVIASTVVITGMCWFFCSKLKEEAAENFAFLYGTSTGTVSTGFVLLRMIDPENKSSAPNYLAMGCAFSTPTTVLTTMIVHMELLYDMPVYVMLGTMAAFALLSIVAIKLINIPSTKTAWEN